MSHQQNITDVRIVGATGSNGRLAAPGRRTFLRGVAAGGITAVSGLHLAGCSPASSPGGERSAPAEGPASTATPGSAGRRVLLAYFSRPGENYYYGRRTNLKVGNTQVLAGMISERIECDVLRIKAAEPYPDSYDATVTRNSREQDDDARPEITNLPSSIDRYDTVLLGSPIWNVRPPMIMSTFTDAFGFRGKTVFPFVTYAVSGLGSTERDYADSCPGATIGEGLAVRGEKVRDADADARSWLRRIGLLPG
ncbi:flavodoxin [Streptomyces boninensis]|uniref:flavodoxin n=1 Tax=Streptomyces boninensis TaxID=2039455 RepID=UPI003B2104B8